MSQDLWVIIPAFNEGPVVGDVVRQVRARHPKVVVVDDCSQDDTGAAAAAAGAVVIRHPINLGQGAALQTGIRYALATGADYVVTFDADGQHRASDIDVLLETQRRAKVDVVVGTRFLGATQNMPPLRRIVLKLAILFTRITSGVKLTDVHNGLRLFTRRAAARIRITQDRMAHASEITDQIRGLGLTLAEAPVTVIYTEYSLRKGQKLGNAIRIVADLVVGRIR